MSLERIDYIIEGFSAMELYPFTHKYVHLHSERNDILRPYMKTFQIKASELLDM